MKTEDHLLKVHFNFDLLDIWKVKVDNALGCYY
jgi:hypothetical protein